MADPRGRGPLGGETNAPTIDPQTQARNRTSAPDDRKAPALPPDIFDVSRLLPVFAANGWTVGESFLRFWIAGKACVARLDPKLDKATISANTDNDCIRIYVLSWDWLLGRDRQGGFAEAKSAFRTFVDDRLFNDAACRQIVKTYGGRRGPFGTFLADGLGPEKFRDRIAEDQLQNLPVQVPHDLARLNDLVAALADFGYYAMYRGETIAADQFASRLKDLRPRLSSLNPSPSSLPESQQDTPLVETLRARYQALIVIDAVGVYAGDLYEFNGWQYLGNWDLKNQKVWGNRAYALDSWLFDGVTYGESVNVENATFRRYRDATGRGGDFLALSPIKLIAAKRLIPVP